MHEKKGLGKKYGNEPELWVETEKWVREAVQEGDIEFVEVPGEAAFYGPKIDVQVWSAIGKEFTLATNQVDFAIPRRFNLTYTDADGSENTPICIHRAPLGTHERFIGFLIEHFGGNFPLWLAPVQVAVLPVSDRVLPYAQQVTDPLCEEDIRVTLNERADKVGSKIRQAELSKINVMLIVGLNEVENGTVSVRRRFKGNIGSVSIETLISDLKSEIKNRSMTHKQEADAEA
jgi:threonyl-tRNA synthetase